MRMRVARSFSSSRIGAEREREREREREKKSERARERGGGRGGGARCIIQHGAHGERGGTGKAFLISGDTDIPGILTTTGDTGDNNSDNNNNNNDRHVAQRLDCLSTYTVDLRHFFVESR